MSHPFGPIWTAPILLGVLTIVGLISALVSDGIWDALSALTLGAVVLVGGYYSLRRPKTVVKKTR
jgi:hypothetical protein